MPAALFLWPLVRDWTAWPTHQALQNDTKLYGDSEYCVVYAT